jgi:hypothetical protein
MRNLRTTECFRGKCMAAIKLTVCLLCCAAASYVALMNAVGGVLAMLRRWKGDTRGYSCVPVVSLILSIVAWLAGRSQFGLWPLLPAVLDVGNWLLVYLPFYLVWQWRKGRVG